MCKIIIFLLNILFSCWTTVGDEAEQGKQYNPTKCIASSIHLSKTKTGYLVV